MALPKPLKYACIAGGSALFGIIFGWVMFPAILKHMLKKEMALSKKTDVRKMWEKIPFPLDYKVYFFNYTNTEEIMKGAIPIVKEIGPYFFEEWKEKMEIEDNEINDTISYKKKDVFYFKPELSAPGLTGEEIVVIPHLFILGSAISMNRTNPGMLGVVTKGMSAVFDKPPDVFMRVKVLDILFRGIVINCARTEFAPKAVCTVLKKDPVPNFQFEPNSQIRFSLFGKRNNTIDPHVVTVKRGIKNIMEVGTVVAIDGAPEMKMWKGTCNEYSGTDGTVFPPFLTEKDRIQSYLGDVCRPFKPWYQKKTSYRGIKTNRYTVNIGDFSNDPELNCFCDAPDNCPPKGMMDMTKCLSAPMYASMPHFLDCDPSLLNDVVGLNPNVDEHSIEIDFEPISGTPMMVKQRIQFNIVLIKADKCDLCKNLPNTFAPIFWIDEGLALNKTFVNMLKFQLFIPKRIVGVIRWWLVSFGGLGVLVGLLFHFRDDIMRIATSGDGNKVTNVTPEEDEQKEISVIGQGQEPAKINM